MPTGDDVIRVHAVVTGMVQGVGFRYFVVTKVRAIGGISGWVRNRFDGSVEVEAQGSRGAVAQLVSALKVGPRWSQVEHVAVDEVAVLGGGSAGSSALAGIGGAARGAGGGASSGSSGVGGAPGSGRVSGVAGRGPASSGFRVLADS